MYRLLRSLIIICFSFGLFIVFAIALGRKTDSPILSYIAVHDDVTDIFFYDVATGLETNLTDSIEAEWDMSWSQNQDSLVYTASVDPSNLNSLYLMSHFARPQRLPIPESILTFGVEFAPDGQSIAYFSSYPHNYSDIYLTDLNGFTRNLTQTEKQSEDSPRWSPDSRQLLFLRDGDLYLVDTQTQETELFFDYEVPIDDMFWSPDAHKIAFFSNVWQKGYYIRKLHIIDAATKTLQIYDLASEPRIEPLSWSPDSCCIVLGLSSGELAIIALETAQIRYLGGEGRRFAPAWSPDARWIAFMENRRVKLLDLFTNTIYTLKSQSRVRTPLHWMP